MSITSSESAREVRIRKNVTRGIVPDIRKMLYKTSERTATEGSNEESNTPTSFKELLCDDKSSKNS
jgi:hypothetical protein